MTERKDNLRAYFDRLLDERLRSYVVVVAAALLVIFVTGLIAGSLMAGLVPMLIGLAGLALRWPAMPMICAISVAWFQALPLGVPVYAPDRVDPKFTHFRIQDLMLVAAVLVYLIAQYRLYALAHRAIPNDRILQFRRPGSDLPELRDPDRVEEREIPQILVLMAGALVAGQVLWLILSETVLNFRILPPFEARDRFNSGSVPSHASREILFALGLGLSVFFARLGFWYWKLRGLNRDEAQLVLADTGWSEMRREAARLETWRAYGKYRTRAKEVVAVPKRRKRRQEPWLAKAIGRACLTLALAIFIAVVLVCGGAFALRSILD